MEIFNLNNRNDNPFTISDIKNQPLFKEFTFPGIKEFIFLCNWKAEPMKINGQKRKNEKIIPTDFPSEEEKILFNKHLGFVYIITSIIDSDEYIIKIGSSRTTPKARLASYNCGVTFNWRTASTTNIKILQSLLLTRLNYKFYILPSDKQTTFNWHGVTSVPFASSQSLAYEDILIKEFKRIFKRIPLANVQANATKVNT